ncbi:hypothetical protein EDD15DRAFT_2372366 [Pisolithus albus]|nr:hypothetical protein EDD15DRAFT_2372366 [Pisolithus albus]
MSAYCKFVVLKRIGINVQSDLQIRGKLRFLKRIGINVQSDPHSGASLNEFLAIDADVCILQIRGKLRNWADERQGPVCMLVNL